MVAPELVVLDVHETLADLEPLRQRFTGSGAPEHLGQTGALEQRRGLRRRSVRQHRDSSAPRPVTGIGRHPQPVGDVRMYLQLLHALQPARDRVVHRQRQAVDMTEQPGQAGRPTSAKGRALPVAASAKPSGSVPANQVVEHRRGAAVGRRRRRMQAAPERLPLRGRLLRCAAAAVRDGRRASVGPARRRGGRHDDRPDQPPRNAVAAGLHPADGDRPDPRPARARSGRPMRVHAWSGTGDRDHGVRPGLAMSPGADAPKRARLDGRLAGTSSCAR